MWCDGKDESRKRKVDDASTENPASKHSSLSNSSHHEIEDLTQELSTIHSDKYNHVQYKLWARMIVNQQHRDKDNPPNIPMIMGKPDKKSKKDFSESLADCAVATVKALQAPVAPTTHTCPV